MAASWSPWCRIHTESNLHGAMHTVQKNIKVINDVGPYEYFYDWEKKNHAYPLESEWNPSNSNSTCLLFWALWAISINQCWTAWHEGHRTCTSKSFVATVQGTAQVMHLAKVCVCSEKHTQKTCFIHVSQHIAPPLESGLLLIQCLHPYLIHFNNPNDSSLTATTNSPQLLNCLVSWTILLAADSQRAE